MLLAYVLANTAKARTLSSKVTLLLELELRVLFYKGYYNSRCPRTLLLLVFYYLRLLTSSQGKTIIINCIKLFFQCCFSPMLQLLVCILIKRVLLLITKVKATSNLKQILEELITLPPKVNNQYILFLINPSRMHLIALLSSFFY